MVALKRWGGHLDGAGGHPNQDPGTGTTAPSSLNHSTGCSSGVRRQARTAAASSFTSKESGQARQASPDWPRKPTLPLCQGASRRKRPPSQHAAERPHQAHRPGPLSPPSHPLRCGAAGRRPAPAAGVRSCSARCAVRQRLTYLRTASAQPTAATSSPAPSLNRLGTPPPRHCALTDRFPTRSGSSRRAIL